MTTSSQKTTTGKNKRATPPSKPTPNKRSRDAAATTQHIAATALHLLTEKGFTGLGVNAIAAAAGIDKQLIYYYFGGLDGLIRHLGNELSMWLGTPLTPAPGEPYAKASFRLLMEYNDALRKNKLVLRLLAWELVEPSELLSELEVNRSAAMAVWVSEFRAAVQPAPQGVDAPAVNAILLAGLHYLALREQSLGTFAGMDIRSEQGIARIRSAVELITASVYQTSPTLKKASK